MDLAPRSSPSCDSDDRSEQIDEGEGLHDDILRGGYWIGTMGWEELVRSGEETGVLFQVGVGRPGEVGDPPPSEVDSEPSNKEADGEKSQPDDVE